MITYFNNKFLPLEDVHISPFDRGFQFADGVYEALRTYNGKIFLLDKHLARLRKSLEGIELPFNRYNELENIFYELINKNNLKEKEAVFYLQITRGAYYPRKHVFPRENVNPTIFISLNELKESNSENGVKVILEKDIRWSRCNIKSIMLLPASLAKQKAVERGAYDAVWIRDGLALEGTHTNLFAVKNRTVITPPLSDFILEGVTRNFVIELCRINSIPFKEKNILVDNLKSYNEFFLTGTTTEIKPVTQIDEMITGKSIPGAITGKLINLFENAISK